MNCNVRQHDTSFWGLKQFACVGDLWLRSPVATAWPCCGGDGSSFSPSFGRDGEDKGGGRGLAEAGGRRCQLCGGVVMRERVAIFVSLQLEAGGGGEREALGMQRSGPAKSENNSQKVKVKIKSENNSKVKMKK